MSISRDRLRSFVRETVAEYDKRTVLGSISDLEIYDETQHSYRDFIQLGKRINLPERFFYEDSATHTASLSTSFIDSLIISEEKFVLSTIEDSVEQDQLDSYEVDEFTFGSLITESFDHVYDADYIYIPNDKEYRMILQEWRERGRVKYEDRTQYVLGASEIEVRWIPSSWGFTDAFIFNSRDIEVVQKRYVDAKIPNYIEHIRDFDAAENDDKLMVYIGEHPEEPDEFEFFYRVVVSEPRFTGYSPHGATIARLPDSYDS
jgi:hypothetical protein